MKLEDHPLLDDEDRAMQRFADECMKRRVGGSFSWRAKGGVVETDRSRRDTLEIEVLSIDESTIRAKARGYSTIIEVPREPLRAALAFKMLRAQAGGSPN